MNPTIEERVSQLEREVQILRSSVNGAGAEPRHPADFAGIGADDPFFDEWIAAIEERRRRIDADPSAP